jgi:hypothetical protein
MLGLIFTRAGRMRWREMRRESGPDAATSLGTHGAN